MKCLKLLAVVSSLIIISAAANAQVLLLDNATHVNFDSVDTTQPTLITYRIVTDHRYSAIYYVEDFKGISTTEPCSDLTLVKNYYSVRSEVVPMNEAIISYDLLFGYGPAATCIKTEITLNGMVFSTGNIKLIWDEGSKTYTAAEPSSVTVDLSKGDK
jgi:hypothetical protein